MTKETITEKSDSMGGEIIGSMASPHFEEYRTCYPARPPDLTTQRFPDEVDDKSPDSEVCSLTTAPAGNAVVAVNWGDKATMHLWLIGTNDVRVALENGELGKSCSRKRLAHTNLFGATLAHSGGELWFRDDTHIWFNGGSGRYPARSPEELEASAEGFRKAGYKVCCFGWDEDEGRPARILLEGEEVWK